MKHTLVICLLLSVVTVLPAQAGPTIFAAKCCHDGSTVSILNTGNNTVASGFGAGYSVTQLIFSKDGSTAYLLDAGANAIQVMSVATNQITQTISLPSTPVAMALTPNGRFLYVSVNAAVAVVNLTLGQVVHVVKVGSYPQGLAVTPDGSRVYVANYVAPQPPDSPNIPTFLYGTVSVIDTSSNLVVRTLIGPYYATSIAITPNGRTVYVGGGGSVYFFPTALNVITGGVGMGGTVSSLTMSADGTTLYIGDSQANRVGVLSTSSNTITNKISVSGGVLGMGVSPDGSLLYAAMKNNQVAAINTASGSVVTQIPVGDQPTSVTFTSDGSKAYVTNSWSSEMVVADGATKSIIGASTTLALPWDVAAVPSRGAVYVTNWGSNEVDVVNTSTFATVARIPVGIGPRDLAATPDQSRVYVVNQFGSSEFGPSTVSVIDTSSNTVTQTITTDNGVYGQSIAFSPDGSKAYVTHAEEGPTIVVIDTSSNTVVDTITVPNDQMWWIAITPDGKTAYATGNAGSLYGIDLATKNIILNNLRIGECEERLAINPAGTEVWVADNYDQAVVVVSTATNTITKRIPVLGGPSAIAFTPDGSQAFVTEEAPPCVVSGGPAAGANIAIIDATSHQVTGSIPIGGPAQGLAVLP